MFLRWIVGLAAVVLVSACGGSRDELTVYLPQRLGPNGPPGQIAPVLSPVERERRPGMSAAWQAVLELRVGPSPDERARGFGDALAPATRLRAVGVRDGTATVELAGAEPAYRAAAAIVLSLTVDDTIRSVRIRLDGKPCCFYTHAQEPVKRATRAMLRGWSGEPCHLRTWPGAVRCRSDSDG